MYQEEKINYRRQVLTSKRKLNNQDKDSKQQRQCLLKTAIRIILLRFELYIEEEQRGIKSPDIGEWGLRLIHIVRFMIYWSEKFVPFKITKYEKLQNLVNKHLTFIIYYFYHLFQRYPDRYPIFN